VAPSKRLTRNTAALSSWRTVKNLAHNASLQLLDKTAPSKLGIKHCAPVCELRDYEDVTGPNETEGSFQLDSGSHRACLLGEELFSASGSELAVLRFETATCSAVLVRAYPTIMVLLLSHALSTL
jgi:hypothetical protein